MRVPPGHVIRVPAGSGARFEQAYATLSPGQRYREQTRTTEIVVVRRGDSIGRIAQRHGLSVRELLAANDLGSRATIRAGQKLQVPVRDASAVVETQVASVAQPVRVKATAVVATPRATAAHRTHRVRTGQTLGAIARRYRTSIQTLRDLNGLGETDVLRAGATIKVPRG